jgi:hypothetical protein
MIKIPVRKIENDIASVQSFIKSVVPRGAVKVALAAIKDYFLGNEQHGLKHYEPYKYVKPFRSYSNDPEKAARQRRWIFAHLDQIGQNNRTGKTADAWEFKETNNGYGVTLLNKSKGAKWIWGDNTQTRHQAAVGHRTVANKIASNLKGALRHAKSEVNKFLKAKRK